MVYSAHATSIDQLRSRLCELKRRSRRLRSDYTQELSDERPFSVVGSLYQNLYDKGDSAERDICSILAAGRHRRASVFNGLFAFAALFFEQLAGVINAILLSLSRLILSRVASPSSEQVCIEQTTNLIGQVASLVSFMHSSAGHPLYAHIRTQH